MQESITETIEYSSINTDLSFKILDEKQNTFYL